MMAEAYQVYKQPNTQGLLIAALVGLGGIGLIYLASKGGGAGPVDSGCLAPGDEMSLPFGPNLTDSGVITMQGDQTLDVANPAVYYKGAGRDVYTAARIVQDQGAGRGLITVYGSGIAGVHLMPSSALAANALVPPSQQQPAGVDPGVLRLYPFRGHDPASNPICGWDAFPGPADLYLEVFGICNIARDGVDGFASVTCNNRVPVRRKVWQGKILFV